ncbi:MAG: riboflavin biosynthesis protein RibF [Elusimicrobia bacterium]|jgi:riboflavin kinase/FMN adenylyltransferase|nr:riboflavin biosynthesis protein RibF [Elusimicrobiota bacterium]
MLKIYKNYKDINFKTPRAVAIGVFDGVHRGHAEIFKNTIKEARDLKCSAAVVTFDFNGRNFNDRKKLTVEKEKYGIMEKYGINDVIRLQYGEGWEGWDPRKFIDDFLLARLKSAAVIVGRDFRFGKNRNGSVKILNKTLKKSGLKLVPVELMKYRGKKISSSYIKKIIKEGRMESAEKMLGRPYSFTGEPVRGKGVGKELGFPTINFKVPDEKLLPEGVFEVTITLLSGQKEIKKRAVCFIGRVQVKSIEKKYRTVEVHIPGYEVSSGEIPRKTEFKRFIRRPMKFNSCSELQKQIKKDIKAAVDK